MGDLINKLQQKSGLCRVLEKNDIIFMLTGYNTSPVFSRREVARNARWITSRR